MQITYLGLSRSTPGGAKKSTKCVKKGVWNGATGNGVGRDGDSQTVKTGSANPISVMPMLRSWKNSEKVKKTYEKPIKRERIGAQGPQGPPLSLFIGFS